MDIGSLATEVTAALAPLLPYLLQAGEKVAEETGKKIAGDGWDWAKSVWSKLRPTVAAKPAALEAAQDVALAPDNTDMQAALRVQLTKLLNENPSLAQELQRLLQQGEARGINVSAIGNQSIAIGGNVSGSTLSTGNQVLSSDIEHVPSDPPMPGDWDDDFMRKRK